MNKEQYMEKLRTHLASLPEQDREDAIAFYEEYLTELTENDPEKIAALDDPARVAAQIKAESAIKGTQAQNVKEKKGISAVWAVLLGILALPIGVPLAVAVAAVVIALIVVVLLLVLSLFVTAASIFLTGAACLVSGIVLLFSVATTGIFYIGCGLMGLGIGYILIVGIYGFSKGLFGWIARSINKIRVKMQKKSSIESEVA